MSLVTIFILAVGLGIDAFSVAIGIGASNHKKDWAPVWRLSFAFGFFQFGMACLGWLAGSTVVDLIQAFDHWIAFGLLTLVGGKMIREGFEKEEKAAQCFIRMGQKEMLPAGGLCRAQRSPMQQTTHGQREIGRAHV